MITASKVWVVIIGGALTYDVIAIHYHADTLSEWCGKHPRTTLVVGSYLLAHLMGRPARLHSVDPLHLAANRIRQRENHGTSTVG